MSYCSLKEAYGLIVSIVFIGTMLLYVTHNKYENDDYMEYEDILKVIIVGFVIWSFFSLILFLQKSYT